MSEQITYILLLCLPTRCISPFTDLQETSATHALEKSSSSTHVLKTIPPQILCLDFHPKEQPKHPYLSSHHLFYLVDFAMATVTSAAVSIPSFTGLKSSSASTSKVSTTVKVFAAAPAPKLTVEASWKEFGAAVAATAASAILASNALAIDIKLGGDDGELAFIPREFSVAPGETINFKNNAGFPHNVVFDEDGIPSGVDASKISQEEYMNGPGENFSVALTEKGTYKFYCEPHQSAGMVGQVTVK